jgi:hypothetical protein
MDARFRLKEGASATARTIASFETDTPLKSGWAWGQKYLKGGIALMR